MTKGTIVQIMGPVVDVEFPETLPAIQNALEVSREDGSKLALEVSQHLGGNRVRTIAMATTDGLTRKMEVEDTGAPISVPIGKEVLGRMFNVLGEPIDGLGEVKTQKKASIHQPAPSFEDQKVEAEIFETGIKVVDLLAPFIKGGKIGLFGGAGVGKT